MTIKNRSALLTLAFAMGAVACEPEDGLPDGGVAAPDLYVKAVTLNPATPTDHAPVSVTVTVGNRGSAPLDEPMQVAWYGGENFPTPGCEWTLGAANFPIPAGGELSVACTYAGYQSWYANINTKTVVDATNVIDEGSPEAEANNTLLKAVTVTQAVTPQPDLVVSSATLDPATPVAGQPVRVAVTIVNNGTAAVPAGSYAVRWFAGENFPTSACDWTVATALAAGAKTTVTCTYAGYASWYASINTKTIVDANNVVTEANETNNTLLSNISVSKP